MVRLGHNEQRYTEMNGAVDMGKQHVAEVKTNRSSPTIIIVMPHLAPKAQSERASEHIHPERDSSRISVFIIITSH